MEICSQKREKKLSILKPYMKLCSMNLITHQYSLSVYMT